MLQVTSLLLQRLNELTQGLIVFSRAFLSHRVFVMSSYKSQKSIPAQIRQRILYISHDKGYVDGFVQELTFAKRLYGYIL